MAKKNNENKVIYAALTLVLTVLSILVIVTGIATRRSERNVTDDTKDTEKETVAERNEDRGGKKTDSKDVMADIPQDETETDKTEKDPVSEPDRTPTKPPVISDTDASEINTEAVEDVNAEPQIPEFISPARGTLSKEHSESVLVYSVTMGDYRTHSGVDIITESGEVVVAAADGVIAEVWEDPMWGYCISIEHEGDAVSYYKNLSRESINIAEVGAEISAGDVIGAVGDSALYEIAEEPHLHFELKIGGVSVDPLEYFELAEDIAYED